MRVIKRVELIKSADRGEFNEQLTETLGRFTEDGLKFDLITDVSLEANHTPELRVYVSPQVVAALLVVGYIEEDAK